MTDGPIIEASNVEFSYDGSDLILRDVGLTLHSSEILGILGPNGSGKTTFVKCLN
ncbi:MAG: ATP-binding cassette domain-containing protein, partial [Thermoplasmata archaeon]|nr:ATP-binding cassette domain-containing protein [Thermoplasmata archaeon]